jgi:Fic family protein/DNA-binding XRE family transcriptional regulator
MNYHTQLRSILKASGWSQEQLAHNLGVSFATLNSWVNQRSQPRAKALLNIDKLYLNIEGVESVDKEVLQQTKLVALKLKSNAKVISENKKVLDTLALYLTYHTNTIEGSTMTLSDVEEVLFEHKVLSNRTAVEQAEARNHQATLYWLLEQLIKNGNNFVFDETLILGIHLRLMNGIISDAGQYRQHSVRIIGSHVALANYAKIPELVSELTDMIEASKADTIELLASTHARFEQIHPFSDGNGRTGRLILLAQALKAGMVPPLVVKERKYAYYKYLELAQTKGDHEPLELFISQSMLFTQELLKNN